MENQSSEAKILDELDTLIRARYTLLAVNTYEEDRLKECLLELVTREKHREKPLYFWSRTNGIVKIVDEKANGVPLKEAKAIQETEDPISALEFIQTGDWNLSAVRFRAVYRALRTGRPGAGQAAAGSRVEAQNHDDDRAFRRTAFSRHQDARKGSHGR